MFLFDLLFTGDHAASWPLSKNVHLIIAQTHSGTDPLHLHALYVVCTQLFYNKNVLNAQKWCGLTHHAFFSCSCVLKGTSNFYRLHHHAFLQMPLTLQIYCSLRIVTKNVGFLIIQNSNCCIMSDCHNGGKKAAKTVVFTDVLVCRTVHVRNKDLDRLYYPVSFHSRLCKAKWGWDSLYAQKLNRAHGIRCLLEQWEHMLTMYDVWNCSVLLLRTFSRKEKRYQH